MIQIYKNIKYKFFWGGKFSNFYPSEFTINNITFNCGEQYFMYQKAITFNDIESANKILLTETPNKQKALGKKIKNFDSKIWDKCKYQLIKRGLIEKFNQNLDLKKYLLEHKDCIMVEASPYDRIWGIGFTDIEAIKNFDNWGENLLGKILTELSNELI